MADPHSVITFAGTTKKHRENSVLVDDKAPQWYFVDCSRLSLPYFVATCKGNMSSERSKDASVSVQSDVFFLQRKVV